MDQILAPKFLFGRKEAAFALSISERCLDELIDTGRIRSNRLGKLVMIHRDELERFAALVAAGDEAYPVFGKVA